MATLEIWDYSGQILYTQPVQSIQEGRDKWCEIAGGWRHDEPYPCEFTIRAKDRVFYTGDFITDEC